MKLRFPSSPQQLLFAAAAAVLWIFPAGSTAQAQDLVITTTGEQKQVKVVGMAPSGQTLNIVVGQGQLGLPIASIKEVRMTPPPEFAQALAAYQAKDYNKALTFDKAVVDKFKGMPSTWAQQATSFLGDLYIALNDLPKAEAAYNDFKKFYPSGGSLASDVGLSRLAVAKKDYDGAKAKLQPITEAALQEKVVNPANALAYSQAFLVSGQVNEAQGRLSEALQDYLRTVTYFYQDSAAVAAAKERADALQTAHKDLTVP